MTVKLEHGKYYHIYNRGNNYENIFIDKYDYEKFIYLLDIFISPIAEILSWSLLKNHFHICVRIKNESEIGYLNKKFMKSNEYDKKWKTYFPEVPDEQFSKKPIPTQQFKHCFNTYARIFNIRHGRIGSLFIKNFKRKTVSETLYLQNLIAYIHNNPVKHKFVSHPVEYPWSSYLNYKTNYSENLNLEKIEQYFSSELEFDIIHQTDFQIIEQIMSELIIE